MNADSSCYLIPCAEFGLNDSPSCVLFCPMVAIKWAQMSCQISYQESYKLGL